MKIDIYDPPMCCSTGVCGPDVDDEVVEVNELINQLKADGITVNRYLLNQQPNKFMEASEITGLLQENGAKILPITVVDGEIIKKRNYPELTDLKPYLSN
ncbi:MAG: arsenite efflux transporter metallochaperone ArsD [Halarsenatibacteraceae bacterium]